MQLHYLQHVAFEDPAYILRWAEQNRHTTRYTMLHEGQALPSDLPFDLLVVMGGPMSIYDEKRHTWLAAEKRFIERAIDAGKAVLGICLGAQLIADVLGAPITANAHKEIGWFEVAATPAAADSPLFAEAPERFIAFHWHGETFAIPEGAVHLARSVACENQAFAFGDRVLALQFHLEATGQSVGNLIRHCADELTDGPYIQNPAQMHRSEEQLIGVNRIMAGILDNLTRTASD